MGEGGGELGEGWVHAAAGAGAAEGGRAFGDCCSWGMGGPPTLLSVVKFHWPSIWLRTTQHGARRRSSSVKAMEGACIRERGAGATTAPDGA